MHYTPQYVTGQILVLYKGSVGVPFAQGFGARLQYALIAPWKYGLGVFVHQTIEGKEAEAIQDFQAYPAFIDWAARRDSKLEERWKDLEERIQYFQQLRSNADTLSDEAYVNARNHNP